MLEGTILLPAVRIPAPGLHGTTGSDAIPVNVSTATSGSSSAAVALTASTATYWNKFITFSAVTYDCWIAFGASGIGNATVADWYIPAGTSVSFWIEKTLSAAGADVGVVTHFKVIAAGVGTLNWAVSSI